MGIADHERQFRQWLGEHTGLLFKVVRSFADGPADQDNLFQEILLQVWLSSPNFREESKPTTWLYRVALNTALTWKRREKKHRGRQSPLPAADSAAPTAMPENADRNGQLVDQLYAAIRGLPLAKRALVVLCSQPIDVKPDQLLKVARLQRLVYFLTDMVVIAVFLSCGTRMLAWTFRDIHNDWPWLVYSACLAWVVGYILFNRWRRRLHAPRYDEPLLAHVEWSIKDIEQRMWLDQNSFWWYILPIALGCMIPPAISFAMNFGKIPGWAALFEMLGALLIIEGVFALIFYFVDWSMKKFTRLGLEAQRQELQALRSLRETLLNADE